MIKILIADDHAIVRAGLKQIVADTSDIVVTGEAGNGHEALSMALNNGYDIILLDITMPDRNGLDILKELKAQRPDSIVLMLSMHPEEQYAKRVLKAGAAGYLTKESAPDELITAIRKVNAGGRYVSSKLAEIFALDLGIGAQKPNHLVLSDREYQVASMLVSGKTITNIARELVLSPKTVHTYRSRIMQKLRLRNNADLFDYAKSDQLY